METIKILITAAVTSICFLAFCAGLFPPDPPKKKKKNKKSKPETPLEAFSITEECPHNQAQIMIIEACVTCETTQLVCADCGEPLEEPKTEC